MSNNVVWVENASWEPLFYGLPGKLPWPAEADPEGAKRQPLDLETLCEAIDRLGVEAVDPWSSFRAATGLFSDLSDALEEGEIVKAYRVLEEIERLHPGTPFISFQKGSLARLEGNDEEAIANFEKTVEDLPTMSPAWSNLGTINASVGNRERAVECFQKALEVNANDQVALDGLVRLRVLVRLVQQGGDASKPEAVGYVDVPSFQKMVEGQLDALAEKPDELLGLADRLLRDGLILPTALKALEKANEVRPGHGPTLAALTGAYRLSGRNDLAKATVERYTEMSSEDPAGFMNLAQACNALGDREGEQNALEQVLRLDPNYHAAIGISFGLKAGEHDPEKENAVSEWATSAGSWMGHLIASSVARKRGDVAAALRHAERAYGLNADSEEVLLHYSAVLGESRELTKLTTVIRPAVESRKYSNRLDWNYAQTLHQLGLRDEAAGVLRRALSQEGIDEEFKAMAGGTLELWMGVLAVCGVQVAVHASGYVTAPVLITLPDGDGGVVVGAGKNVPAEGRFPWKVTGDTLFVVLQQGESGGTQDPVGLGAFRIQGVNPDEAGPVECHVTVMADGQMHFRAAQNGRRLPVQWGQLQRGDA
jgi:tetratricopeptide (TPR) repeat protein